MKLNKPLIRKMIKRIETMPETYNQREWRYRVTHGGSRPVPVCGTAACLAGEAIICSERSVKKGIEKLFKTQQPAADASALVGFSDIAKWNIFWSAEAEDWPEPFRTQFQKAKGYRGEARAAVNLLKAILRTDGKILER